MLATFVLLTGCEVTRLDADLCPRDAAPPRTTVLLLDTSDPLTPKQREVFAQLVREMQNPAGASDFRIAPGEALVVYELASDLDNVAPVLRVCNPGDRPDDWGIKEELTQGRLIAQRQWQNFLDRVEPIFAERTGEPQPSSPILEFLSVIVPRHAPSARMAGTSRTHLVIYSDLLQHSDTLSHYGPYPAAADVSQTPGMRQLNVDLAQVEVSLYRLERERDARWQTADHYYWWTKLMQAFGGKIIWQQSV